MARKKNKKRKLEKNITFLVEGITEKYYLSSLLDEFKYKKRKAIISLDGGGYKDFLNKIHKNKDIYDVIIVITDMDKASTITGEMKNLLELIKLLEKQNLNNNIFLTFKDIEEWMKKSLPSIKGSLIQYLGYSGSTKGKEDIYKRLSDKGGSFKLAKNKFKEENLFYIKKDESKGKIIKENKSKIQSNLMYFDEYLEKLNFIEK